MTLNELGKKAISGLKKMKQGAKYLIEDSRNMGRLSLGIAVLCFPLALTNPLAFAVIATCAIAAFGASIYFRGRKEDKDKELFTLTNEKGQGKGVFKGVRLKKLQVQKSSLKDLGLRIQGQALQIDDPSKLEVLGIKAKHVELKITTENGQTQQCIHFKTDNRFSAVAKVIEDAPTAATPDAEHAEGGAQNQELLTVVTALQEETGLLKQQLQELKEERQPNMEPCSSPSSSLTPEGVSDMADFGSLVRPAIATPEPSAVASRQRTRGNTPQKSTVRNK